MAELNPEQWAEVERLFRGAAELPPEERADFLQRECAGQDLRQEVASLLEHSGEGLPSASEAIQSAAAALAQEPDPDERLIGTRLGPYKVEAIAGHGGMGAVYRAARDDAEFHQHVAIKLVRVAAESPSTLRRFRQERQILARLSHPNIARLLDGGSTPEGVPYLVMEFIEGEPITAWCERQSLTIEQRLRLFLSVCEAVEFAHRNLVVHRDLKPANILVTAEGVPKLLDFGIAKMLAPEEGAAASTLGARAMTPEYAAPEQVRGDPVTPAADVYSLGLILHEMLTGKRAQSIPDCSPAAIARIVCVEEPPAPSSVRPELAGDLDSIVRMALRKEPERRYRSAGQLGGDIARHLDGLPVTARPDTLAYRAAKFVRRNRAAVVAGAVVVVSLAGGLTFAVMAGYVAEKRLSRASQVTQLTQIGTVDSNYGVATDGARVYFTARKGGHSWLAHVPVNGGTPQPLSPAASLIRPYFMALSPDRSALLVTAGEEGFERPLWEVPVAGGNPRRLGDLTGHAGTWSRDGSRIVFARGPALYLANRDGTSCRELLNTPGLIAYSIRWTPRPGRDILRFVGIDSKMQPLALWEVRGDGTGLHRLLGDRKTGTSYPDGEWDGAWIPSGKFYLIQSLLSLQSQARVTTFWALREGGSLLPIFDKPPAQIYSTPMDAHTLAPSPDSKRVFFAAGQELRELMLYNRKLSQFVPFLRGVAGRAVSYSKDKLWVAYVTYPEGVLWRSRADGSEALPLTPTSWSAGVPRWSPDGAFIAFRGGRPGQPGMGYIVPSAGGKPEPIPGAEHWGSSPSWSPDGKSLVFDGTPSGGAWLNRGVFITEVAGRVTTRVPDSEDMWGPVWSPDGRYLAATRAHLRVMLFDFRTKRWVQLASGVGVATPFWSDDSKYVYYQEVYGGIDQPIWRVQIRTRKIERVVGLRQVPQSNASQYELAGMAPDDAPVASVIRSNSDIYALDLNLP